MYTTIRHELRHAKKAWLGTLDPCVLSGYEHPTVQDTVFDASLEVEKVSSKRSEGRELLHPILKDVKPHHPCTFVLEIFVIGTSSQPFQQFQMDS